jgi:valyl-tRNA synthetase
MPKPHQEYPQMTGYTRTIVDFNSKVWNKKKETISEKTGKPLSLKDFIDISVPAELELFRKDLEMMHNLKR